MPGEGLRARFESERTYLRELGREFAERYPELASMLADTHNDPSVERLLQGVAFLTAQVHARLDDDIPELGQRILRQLCPQLLRPVPSMVVQQFVPPPQAGTWLRVPRRTWVAQPPLPAGQGAANRGPECRFYTIWDVDLPPWTVKDARVQAEPGGSVLRVVLQSRAGTPLERCAPPPGTPLRVHLHGDDRTPQELLYFLHRRLRGPPRLVVGGATPRGPLALPAPRSVGFDPEEALLPGWSSAPEGWRILFEGLQFPEKFHFVDLHGLDALGTVGAGPECTLEFAFDAPFSNELRVSADNLRLGCVPAVNLFEHSGRPLMRLPLRSEYRVLAEGTETRHLEVYTIGRVSGVSKGREQEGSARVEYTLSSGAPPPAARGSTRWYDVQLREASVPQEDRECTVDPWVSFSLPSEALATIADERISLELTCCNAFWPQRLRAGELTALRSALPKGITTHNLRAPTRRLLPPLGQHIAWRTVSALALGRQELSSPEALIRLLDLLNLRALGHERDAAQHLRRCRALQRLTLTPEERMVELGSLPRPMTADGRAPAHLRVPVRGLRLTVLLDYEGLGGPGGAFFFGLLLEHLLASMTGLTGFSALTLQDSAGREPGVHYPPRLGARVLG